MAALALLLLVLPACREEAPDPPVPLTVFATASLEGVAREAAERLGPGTGVAPAIRGGGTRELADELSAGASADLFLAAGLEAMDRLEAEGRIVPGSRWEEVGNRLAILGREEAGYPKVRLVEAATLDFGRFVVADPDDEPAGRWARRWLEDVGVRGPSIWEQLADRREVVPDAAAVLAAIAADPNAVGVVFLSDLGAVPSGEVLFRSPDLGIRYSFALVERPGRPPEAADFLAALRGKEGVALLQRKGFLVEAGAPDAEP